LDKATLKCAEAEHIKSTYHQIKWKLHEEHLQFENTLGRLEKDIRRAKEELKELKRMKADAELSRDAAVKESKKQEETYYSDKKRREQELQRMRKEAEEKRSLHERTERRIVCVASYIEMQIQIHMCTSACVSACAYACMKQGWKIWQRAIGFQGREEKSLDAGTINITFSKVEI